MQRQRDSDSASQNDASWVRLAGEESQRGGIGRVALLLSVDRSLMPFESHIASDASIETATRMEVGASSEQASDGEILSAAPVWLQRVSLFVLVLFCVYLGVLVMILPWWTRMWDQNYLILAHPAVAAILQMGAVRGLISGLGLLDIWIGISEAIHYRDHRA